MIRWGLVGTLVVMVLGPAAEFMCFANGNDLSPSAAAASAPAPSLASGSPSLGTSSSTTTTTQAFLVASAADLALAFQSRASLIYLMDNITLTNDAFPSNQSLTVGVANNITIAPLPNLTSTVILNFGNSGGGGSLTERVSIMSSSVLNIESLQLDNNYFPGLDATRADIFLPFFTVLPGAILNCTAVRFQINPARCATGPDYGSTSNSLRVPWMASEHPELLAWHTLDGESTMVDSAKVPQSYQRINSSYVQPASGTGDIELSACIFFCASTLIPRNDSSSSRYSSAATSEELLSQLQHMDSRTVYIEDNITVPLGEWPTTLVIASSRELLLRSAQPGLPHSPGNDTLPSQLYFQDSSDILEAGYGGNLTFSDLDLLFDSICCSSQSLLGSWYVNQQPLTGSLFDDLIPAALNALPIHTVALAPPAYLSLQNVDVWSKQCDTVRFPRIANSLINALNADAASSGNASYSNGSSISCAHCIFQGTAAQPTNFSDPRSYSTVHLINTTITCKSFGDIAVPPAAAPIPSSAMIGGISQPAESTPGLPSRTESLPGPASQLSVRTYAFAPKASLVAGVTVAVCIGVTAGVAGLWALLQWDFRRLQASYGYLADESEARSTGESSLDVSAVEGAPSLQDTSNGSRTLLHGNPMSDLGSAHSHRGHKQL